MSGDSLKSLIAKEIIYLEQLFLHQVGKYKEAEETEGLELSRQRKAEAAETAAILTALRQTKIARAKRRV